jgi:hypothetical protein
VSGNYAYVADWYAGLQVVNVSNPTNCTRVGGYNTAGGASRLALQGDYVYIADDFAGMVVIDVSNPTNCSLVSHYQHKGRGWVPGIAATIDRTYVAESAGGLYALFSLRNVRSTILADATPGTPFTIEAASGLSPADPWIPLLTTNVTFMPFKFVDFDVKPKKFYRIHQP